MNQDVRSVGVDVEVMIVIARNVQVPHPASPLARHPSADDDRVITRARGPQMSAVLQGTGLDPPAPVTNTWHPDWVAARRVDDRHCLPGPDLEVIQIGVVVHQDRSNGLSLGPARLRIRRENLVTDLKLADRDRLARSEQDLGAGGETLPAYSAAVLALLSRITRSVFCGKAALFRPP